MTAMDILPTELKREICSRLGFASLKCFRQTSSIWAQSGAPFMFSEVWVTSSSLLKLKDFVQSKNISPFVRTLVYLVDRSPYMTLEQWYERSSAISGLTSNKIRHNYENYTREYRGQPQSEDFMSSVEMLEAVQPLPQLHTIQVVSVTWYRLDLCKAAPSFPTRRLDIWRCLSLLKPHLLDLPQELDTYKAFSALRISMMYATSNPIQHLAVGVLPYLDIAFVDFGRTFHNLKTLELELSSRTLFRKQKCMKRISENLSATRALEKLSLRISPDISISGVSNLTDIMAGFGPDLPRLRKIELFGMSVAKASLYDCLQRYRQSLIGLKLDSISLINSDAKDLRIQWSLALRTLLTDDWKIKNVRLLNLSCGSPSSVLILGEEYLRDVERSILRRGH